MNEKEINKLIKESGVDTSLISDGYHTFGELYEFRLALNALLFNQWYWKNQNGYEVHKSKRHHDGEECFGGGWFIVMANTSEGQISFHYELKYWDLFKIKVYRKGDEWDGHTSQEALQRLLKLANNI